MSRVLWRHRLPRRRGSHIRAGSEPLEARLLLTSFSVVNSNDSGPGSLRQAISDANASPGEDVIVFTGTLFSDADPDTIQLTGGRITISDDVQIMGPGASLLTITAGGASQLLYLTGASTDVAIERVTISGGSASGQTLETGSGGAIYNNNSGLTLRQVVLSNSTARVDGGGLYNNAGTVSVIDSTISSNTALRGGGGLATNGRLTVTGCNLFANSGQFGGAVAVSRVGELSLEQSTLSNNSATMDGSGVFNHFGTASLSQVTLTGNSSVRGGPVTNWGSIVISDSRFVGNTAELGAGAANARGGTMFVARSEFADNISTRDGGGLFNGTGGTLHVIDSTVFRNVSTLVGGGLANARDGRVIVTNSTFTENVSDLGGAIANIHDGEMFVINSTVSGNLATGAGGGVFNDGVMTLTNATIVANRSDLDGNGSGGGGGLYTNNEPQIVTKMSNTLVAGNFRGTPASQSANDVGGMAVAQASANNLIGTPGFAGGLVHGANGNIVGQAGANGSRTNLQVSTVVNLSLADNGGPTRTHALVAGSAAINAGNNLLAVDSSGLPLLTDQRGALRFGGLAVDIGAYEA